MGPQNQSGINAGRFEIVYIYIYTLGNSVGGLTERGGCLALAYSQATRCFLLENIEHG